MWPGRLSKQKEERKDSSAGSKNKQKAPEGIESMKRCKKMKQVWCKEHEYNRPWSAMVEVAQGWTPCSTDGSRVMC